MVEKMVAPGAKPQAVAHLQAILQMSEQRAEQPKVPAVRSIVGMAAEGGMAVGADCTSMRYRSMALNAGKISLSNPIYFNFDPDF